MLVILSCRGMGIKKNDFLLVALQERWSEDTSMPRVRSILVAVDLARVVSFPTHVSLHVGDVVVFRQVSIFLHVWALVCRHGGDKVIDDFIRNERVPQVELGDIGLEGLVCVSRTTVDCNSPCHQQPP